MAGGYTCCIDMERLNESIETLSSIDTCLSNKDFSSIFIDVEKKLKNINFEHNNCITDYKEDLDNIITNIDKVREGIYRLSDSLTKTVTGFNEVEDLNDNDLKELANLYDNTSTKNNISKLLTSNIKISNNITSFQNNIDDSIKDFLGNSNLSDYPENYSSLDAWKEDLSNKYKDFNITDIEKEDLVEKDMAIWRQEQTASKVTSLATSDYAEKESNINITKDEYTNEYGMSEQQAKELATIKENSYIDFRKANTNIADVTRIPPVDTTTETQQTTSNSSSVSPSAIGLGIAATGISGAVGAIILDSMNTPSRKKVKKVDPEDDIFVEDDEETPKKYDNYEIDNNMMKQPEPVMNNKKEEPSVPYHALRSKVELNKFYGGNEDIYREVEDDE